MSKLPQGTENPLQPARVAGAVIVAVAIDGRLAGEIRLADELRSGTQSLLQRLRMLGVQRIVLATGDRGEVADAITAGLRSTRYVRG